MIQPFKSIEPRKKTFRSELLNTPQGTVEFCGPELDVIVQELSDWQKQNKLAKFWSYDSSLWTNEDENQWMGWLTLPKSEADQIARLRQVADEIKKEGFLHVVVLGMGGSSLCPALLAKTFGKIANYPTLHVLDSTDPQQIHHLEESLDLAKTLFIVSSKSGSTLEPNIFEDYFYHRLQNLLGKSEVGDRFIAITDPGSSLESKAKGNNFRAIFPGVPSVGGRYSALSNFGMAPAGLMGINVEDFLSHAALMAQACSQESSPESNPGVVLGVILGICAKQKKDKVTLIASPGIGELGAWLEQLIAESTGKIGRGMIPIGQEALGEVEAYSNDRVFVYIRLAEAPDEDQERTIAELEKSGFPVVRLQLPNKMHLGAEFFRWEIATAVAGSIIGINPFNQPDVEASKVRTKQLTTEYEQTGRISAPEPFFSENGIKLFTDEKNVAEINHLFAGEKVLRTMSKLI